MGGGDPLEKLRPKWADATTGALAEVMKEKTTVVLHFVAPDNEKPENAIFSAGLHDRSKDKTAFLHVKQEVTPEEGTASPDGAAPKPKADDKARISTPASKLIPATKFAQDDLWVAYGVDKKTGGGTMIVTDQFGNEFKRYAQAPKYKDMERMIDSVPQLVEEKTKKLSGMYAKAKDQHDRGALDKSLKHLLTLFKEGFVGQAPMKEAGALYDSMLEAGREKIDNAVLHDDAKQLDGLRKVYKGTDLEAEIETAAKEIAAPIAEAAKPVGAGK